MKGAIFDLDGVIVDTAKYHYLAWKELAKELGTEVIETELIGLCPMKALIDAAESYLKIADFSFNDQVLENYIL